MIASRLILGDCMVALRSLPDASVDAIVTDPPYGLEFMGKEWDRLGNNGFRRMENEADVGRDNAFGRTSARAPEYRAGREMQDWHRAWAVEALRVLKPGGHLLSFGGTRTSHRLACGLEDAGFEIRDVILAWLFGSGFPKSLDVPKAIDRVLGSEGSWRREDHPGRPGGRTRDTAIIGQVNHATNDENPEGLRHVYEPGSEQAAAWQGWGTALKPAHEPIIVARKPLAGTVAASVLEHGTGALNIDACRIGDNAGWSYPNGRGGEGWHGRESLGTNLDVPMESQAGRWPANVVLVHHDDCRQVGTADVKGDGNWSGTGAIDPGYGGGLSSVETDRRVPEVENVEVWECVDGCPVRELDQQSGVSRSTGGRLNKTSSATDSVYGGGWQEAIPGDPGFGDVGGASRFFYCAKVSRAERNAGLEGFEERESSSMSGRRDADDMEDYKTDNDVTDRFTTTRRNHHPTVKPITLMRWLVRLVTPAGGTVLDPFLGSGSTGIAATLEGFAFIGIEREQDYMKIAEARIRFWDEHGEDGLRILAEREASDKARQQLADAGQLSLLG